MSPIIYNSIQICPFFYVAIVLLLDIKMNSFILKHLTLSSISNIIYLINKRYVPYFSVVI